MSVSKEHKSNQNDRFCRKLLIQHLLVGATKGVVFSIVGALFVDLGAISIQRIVLSGFVIVVLSILLEVIWLYRPARQRHEELRHLYGEQYEREARSAVIELGMRRFVSALWIARKHDELIGKEKEVMR